MGSSITTCTSLHFMKQDSDNPDGHFTYEISVANKFCLVVATGKITSESSIDALNKLANTPGFEKDFNIIVDARNINYHPSYQEVKQIQRHLVLMKDNFRNKIALVTTEFFWVVGELLCRLSQPHGLKISAFSGMEQAQQWISAVSNLIE